MPARRHRASLDRSAPAAMSAVERLSELAALGRHEHGIDRALATPQERAARTLFAQWSVNARLRVTQDAVGNLFACRAGTDPAYEPILIGSHLDTVPTGGAYDGAYGVVAAICALELLDARSVALRHSVEAVAWAGEEGSRFPLGCLGSSAFTGARSVEEILSLTDARGLTLRDALRGHEGGLLDGFPQRSQGRIAAYLELHVEQGPVLEHERVRLGVVSAIAGQRRYRVCIEGESGHAGTVPMARRQDALCAAADAILALESSARSADDAVATVGHVQVDPGGTNVIPASVTFSVDIRSAHEDRIALVESELRAGLRRIERERGVRSTLDVLEARAPAPMDPALRAALHRAAAAIGERALDLSSGAGHDAMCLARIAPSAMLFVPSIGGCSHVMQERTSDADVELGVEALAAAIVEVDRTIGENA